MLDIGTDALAVLRGSWIPQFKVDAWYGGNLVLADVPWVAGSVAYDATAAIIGTGSATAQAMDGSLIPTSWDSPLACYGSELQVRAGIPYGQSVDWFSLGWFVINDFAATEWYRDYPHPDGTVEWVPMGVQVVNSLLDRWELIDQATFAVPDQPASTGSVLAEIARLVDGIVALEDLSAVDDAAIPTTVVYSDSRTQAIQDLAAVLNRKARMSRDGALDLVPLVPSGDPVWSVTVDNDDTVARVLDYSRKGDRSGLFNQFVSTGTSTGGSPVQGVVTTSSGPLRFGGPLGQLPYRHESALITTITAAQADAATQQDNMGGAQTVLIPVTVPFNPALETDDILEVVLPNVTLTGPVVSIAPTLGSITMSVTVKVSRAALWGDRS